MSFLEFLWPAIVIFFMIIFIMMLFQVLGDLFRRDDASGGTKALWVILLVLLPFIGVVLYTIVNSTGMAQRQREAAHQTQRAMDDYIRGVAHSEGPADQIAKAKGLLDSGAISQAEFDAIKARAIS